MGDKDQLKADKKLAKTAAKEAKKGAVTPEVAPAAPAAAQDGGKSPAERSAQAAERQLALNRWRLIFAAVGALIALLSLIYAVFRS